MSSWRSSAPEAVLVREAMLALGRDRPSLHEAVRRVTRWDRVLALARAHAVAESVWAALSLRGSSEAVPAGVRAELEGDHAGATARNALLLAEAASFQAALRAEGIESVLLKGPALLAAHYPALGARHVGDVDLLLRPAEVERAAEVARRSGAREWTLTVGYEGANALTDISEAILRDPFTGIGKPEPLKYVFAGCWSRRLTQEHRLVYCVSERRIDFLQARYHY